MLTVLVKLAFFPLANKSYRAMSRPAAAAAHNTPEIREKFGNDKQKMNQAMMEMYRNEKVNRWRAAFHPDPDPAALQGAVRHHRDAPCAVLRLDP
ncbi:MAG: YidC/Oxa1 family membrane protein insertase [Alphaproteobacteria bacterium]